MPHDPRKSLLDILTAGRLVQSFATGQTLDDYRSNDLLKSAIERQLGIVGEAMTRLRKDAPQLAAQISDSRAIIAFRNVLVHAYDLIDDETVWETINTELPTLIAEAESLLATVPNTETT